MIAEAIHRNKTYLRLNWPDLALIRMEISLKTKKSTYFFTCTAGHLNSLFVPVMGHLPVCFQKILMPGGRPGGGMGTAGIDCVTTRPEKRSKVAHVFRQRRCFDSFRFRRVGLDSNCGHHVA